MYEKEHTAAVTLQRSLLPDKLPSVPGLALDARYLPRSTDVGGDWYDVFRLPDRRLALLLVNKDPRRPVRVRVDVGGAGLRGPADLYVLSQARYRWHPRGPRGYASPNRGPAHRVLGGRGGVAVTLPAWSLTVLRTRRPA